MDAETLSTLILLGSFLVMILLRFPILSFLVTHQPVQGDLVVFNAAPGHINIFLDILFQKFQIHRYITGQHNFDRFREGNRRFMGRRRNRNNR